jgi:hypothetical protein
LVYVTAFFLTYLLTGGFWAPRFNVFSLFHKLFFTLPAARMVLSPARFTKAEMALKQTQEFSREQKAWQPKLAPLPDRRWLAWLLIAGKFRARERIEKSWKAVGATSGRKKHTGRRLKKRRVITNTHNARSARIGWASFPATSPGFKRLPLNAGINCQTQSRSGNCQTVNAVPGTKTLNPWKTQWNQRQAQI